MYSSHSIMDSNKFLSQGLTMKSLFFLSSSNTFNWCLLKLPAGIGLFYVYIFQTSFDDLYQLYYTYGN